MPLKVKLLECDPYRGFTLGYIVGKHGLKAAWRPMHGGKWCIGCVYVDYSSQIEKLAQECIDFDYKKETEECILGRPLTLEELHKLAD